LSYYFYFIVFWKEHLEPGHSKLWALQDPVSIMYLIGSRFSVTLLIYRSSTSSRFTFVDNTIDRNPLLDAPIGSEPDRASEKKDEISIRYLNDLQSSTERERLLKNVPEMSQRYLLSSDKVSSFICSNTLVQLFDASMNDMSKLEVNFVCLNFTFLPRYRRGLLIIFSFSPVLNIPLFNFTGRYNTILCRDWCCWY
jgi:hypothetical protein